MRQSVGDGLLPQWTWSTLGELAAIQGGIQKQPKRRPQTNHYPFLRVANVHRGRLVLDDVHRIELFGSELEKLRLQRGDLLIVEGNGSASEIGRMAIWNGQIADCVHQNHIIRARPSTHVLPEYLAFYWNSPDGAERVGAVASSTSGLFTLSVSKVAQIAVPLAPLAEQRRIVAALEEHLSDLDAAVAGLERARANVRRYGDALREEVLRGCDEVPLFDLLRDPLSNGRSVPTAATGFPVLRLTALRGGRVDLAEHKIGAWTANDARSFLVTAGDFLIARGNGSKHLVGRGGLVGSVDFRVAYPDTLIRARVDEMRILPEFLRLAWDSRRVRSQIESMARTTAGIYKVNQRGLERVRVPVRGGLQDQRAVVAQVEGHLAVADRTAAEIDVQLVRAKRLRQSILKRAFEGKLVAQDPDDEPAAALLERIRAGRASAAPARRPARGRATSPR